MLRRLPLLLCFPNLILALNQKLLDRLGVSSVQEMQRLGREDPFFSTNNRCGEVEACGAELEIVEHTGPIFFLQNIYTIFTIKSELNFYH